MLTPSFFSKEREKIKLISNHNIYILVLFLGMVVFTYGLFGYVINGAYARYIQDDYCYAAILGRQGFFEGQINAYLEETTFNGNRYSLTLFMEISERIGRFSVQILPGLTIFLWVVGMVLLIQNGCHYIDFSISLIECIFFAEALIYLTLTQAPNLPQILYWRAGMLPYLSPLVMQTYLFAAILGHARQEKTSLPALIGISLLAILAAGFSETAAAFQTGVLGLAFLVSIFGFRLKIKLALQTFRSAWAGFFGTLLGMLFLIISPAGKRMQAMHYDPPQDMLSVIKITIDSVAFFLKFTLYRVTVPTLFTLIFFLMLGFLFLMSHKRSMHFNGRWLVSFLLLPVLAFLLLVCITAPSAFVQGAYPETRALIGARFVIVFSLAVVGLLGGAAIYEVITRTHLEAFFIGLAGLLLSVLAFLLFFIAPGTQSELAFPEIRSYLFSAPYASLLFIIIAFAISYTIGLLIRNVQKRYPYANFLFISVIFVGMLIQPLTSAQRIYTDIPYYQQRASLWDLRDEEIHQAEEQGTRDIQVRAIDSLAGISELQESPGNWINRCAAWLYGMETISAIEK